MSQVLEEDEKSRCCLLTVNWNEHGIGADMGDLSRDANYSPCMSPYCIIHLFIVIFQQREPFQIDLVDLHTYTLT